MVITTLKKFIEDHGNEACAERWGVPLRTVMSWRYQQRVPRPAKALEIVANSDGKLSMEGVYAARQQRQAA